jgi:SdrD B-like domain
MFRTPTFNPAMRKHALPLLFALTCLPFFAKADLGITVTTTQNGDQVTADFLVYNFDAILSMQYTIQWDPAELQFVSLGDFYLPGMTESNFGTMHVDEGVLPLAWFEPTVSTGVTLPTCNSMFQVHFKSLNGQVPTITIGNSPTPIEVLNANEDLLNIEQGGNCTALSSIQGIVFQDDNGNCAKDDGEAGQEDWIVTLQQGSNTYHATSNASGYYVFNGIAGDYELSIVSPENTNLVACQPTANISLGESQTVEHNYGASDPESPSSTNALEQGGFSVKITPNPVQAGQPISIETTTETARALRFQAFDASGKLLHTWERQAQPGTNNFSLNASLNEGIYLLKTVDDSGKGQAVKLMVY